MTALHRFTRRAAQVLEWVVILAVAALVLDVLWGVVTRGLSKVVDIAPSRWTQELAEYLLMWVALLGAAVAFDRREHLGVDYLASKLDPAARRVLGLIVIGVSSIFAAAALVYGGGSLVLDTLATGQMSPSLDIRKGFVYLAAPISGVMILLFMLDQAVALWQQDPHATTHGEASVESHRNDAPRRGDA
ncbi:MAG: TRAP transporter small permease [Planctomycetales bacterium]|nr:TRAP transporter small permease [Planctomycetales bacterium]